MNSQPMLNSLSFQVASYQNDLLHIEVSPLVHQSKRQVINLSKMVKDQFQLCLWVSTSESTSYASNHSQNSKDSEKAIDFLGKRLEDRIDSMEELYKKIQNQMFELHGDNTKLRQFIEQKDKSKKRRASMIQIENEESQRDNGRKMKMEMLNNILQEKLYEKQGSLIELQKKLYDRDELVRQLADKLMTANSDKEEIYSEYEKILQATILNNQEQSLDQYQEKAPEEAKQNLSEEIIIEKESTESEPITEKDQRQEKQESVSSIKQSDD